MNRGIILFELNEVPFRIVDAYCHKHPGSALARLVAASAQYLTLTEDETSLSPWKTWPTLHRGVIDTKHLIQDFGQDLSDVDREYPPLWTLVSGAGLATGVGGSLHSYPPPTSPGNYSFYLPDTFAPGPEAFPSELQVFQDFNLRMARESGRNINRGVPWFSALKFAASARRIGLEPSTLFDIARQLGEEVVRPSVSNRRRTLQMILAFDAFMRQLQRTRPAFATFFTNHVASAMHRYWAAAFPGDYQQNDYDEQWVNTYKDEIEFAMSHADRMLNRMMRFVASSPDYVLWVVSSMGQAATTAHPCETQLYVKDLGKLMAALRLRPTEWHQRPAMLPQYNVQLVPESVEAFRRTLDTWRVDGERVSYREAASGFFSIDLGQPNLDETAAVELHGTKATLPQFGLANVEIYDKSGTTAYHIPQGALLIYDLRRSQAAASRPIVSTLEIAPAILHNFGIPRPAYMKAGSALIIN